MANHDRFPVMWSSYKVAEYDLMLHKVAMGKDKDAAEQAEFDIVALEDQGYIDDVHCVMTSSTHLNALADVIDLGNTYSIGDFSLMLGGWLLTFAPFVFLFDVIRKLKA